MHISIHIYPEIYTHNTGQVYATSPWSTQLLDVSGTQQSLEYLRGITYRLLSRACGLDLASVSLYISCICK